MQSTHTTPTDYTLAELTHIEPAMLCALNALLPQLSSGAEPLTAATAERLRAAGTHLFVATKGEAVAGMATLVGACTPTGRKWWVEDVVVDAAHRGAGVGRALVQHLVAYARSHGGGQLQLTSRPERVAANALYRSLGFAQKQTNVYAMQL